jgi:hypothetical protein
MASLDAQQYVEMGKQGIRELVDREHAVALREIDARLAEIKWQTLSHRIDPHHLTTARNELVRSGELDMVDARTRGGRDLTMFVTTAPRRTTAIEKAARRKRLLLARYLGWAEGTPSRPGIIGPAAERAAAASLTLAAPYGYRLLQPSGAGVTEMLGETLPGPLDNAAIYTALNDDGSPGRSVAIPVEVKNVRDWLYSSSAEVFQLLTKAVQIKQARPDIDVMPVLICRRAHITLFRMAKDLGFFVIDTRRQYILPRVPEEEVVEVRAGLGFLDLTRQDTADERVVRRLTQTLPGYALDRADRWRETAEMDIASLFGLLWRGHDTMRSGLMNDLRELVQDSSALDLEGGW